MTDQQSEAEAAQLRADNASMREALNRIATWGDGDEVCPDFDEPNSAAVARAALAGLQGVDDSEVMRDLLLRANDAIESLDGTTVENEKLVDDYRAWQNAVSPKGSPR